MKIVHILFSFNTGGIENLIVDILNNWDKEDQLFLIIINDSYNASLLSKIKSNVTVLCLDREPGGEKIKYEFILMKTLLRINPDIIHVHNNSCFKFSSIYKLLQPKVRLYLTIHDVNIYNNLNYIDVVLHRILLKRIIAISKSVEAEILNRNVSKSKVKVIYNGIDTKKFSTSKIGTDKKIISCIARLHPEKKGQDILINAISMLNRDDFECWIIGSPPNEHPEYLKQLRQLAVNLGCDDKIKFLGDRNDVPYLLQQTYLSVLPSRFEGFGISIIESMLSKVLVLATNVEGPKEIIKNNEFGYLFEKENQKELSCIINELLNGFDSDIVDRAYDYAYGTFSIESMIFEIDKAYHN